MGRPFANNRPILREMEQLTIIIKDRETIWVMPHKKYTPNIIFHRWFKPALGTYKQWYIFRKALLNYKRLDVEIIYKLAKRYQIQSTGTVRAPTFKGEDIRKHAIIAKNSMKGEKCKTNYESYSAKS